jgi:multicomponent Na+:H+ antiporter subunit G
MIVWALDALLYILLLAAIGFGAISVIGLLLFPDIRSRAFTGLRAGILATALVTAAGICYGIFAWITTDGIQYLMYVLAAILMLVLLVFLNRIATDVVCRKTVPLPSLSADDKEDRL